MTQSEADFSQKFLSTEIAGARAKRLARLVVALSLLGFFAGVPFVRERLGIIPSFIPAYEAALWVTDMITAVLLFGQASQLRSRALAVLASGYLFDGSW